MLRFRAVAFLSCSLLAAGLAFWAGTVVAKPAQSVTGTEVEPHFYEVNEGEVSEEYSVSAQASWATGDWIAAPSAGVITSIEVSEGQLVEPGDALFSVNLLPAIALPGHVPSFREMSLGVEGPDVGQLQRYLIDEGFLSSEVSEFFDAKTEKAVTSWQESNGQTADGVVGLGEVVFIDLPTRVFLAGEVRVGSFVQQGGAVLGTIVGDPEIALLPVGEFVTNMAVQGTTVVVDFVGSPIEGVVKSSSQKSDGSTIVSVGAIDPDQGLCTGACAEALEIPGPTTLQARLIITPIQKGPLVPISAIRTLPHGQTIVVRADGSEAEVDVVVSQGGIAIIDGIETGQLIRLFGEE